MIPFLELSISDSDFGTCRLACGPSYCSHGDFINGWLPEPAQNMLNASSKCDFASVTVPLGGDADVPVCLNLTDADPENGMNGYATCLTMMAERGFGRYAN